MLATLMPVRTGTLEPTEAHKDRAYCYDPNNQESDPGDGLLVIREGEKATRFWLSEEYAPAGFLGRAFLLAKHVEGVRIGDEADEDMDYEVMVHDDARRSSCTCRGFRRWRKRCRHIECVATMVRRGHLPDPRETPAFIG